MDAEPFAVNPPSDDRSPWALAMEWTSRVTGIAMEMALPPLGGIWLDRRLGMRLPIFLVAGVLLGFAAAMIQLCQLARASARRNHDHPKKSPP